MLFKAFNLIGLVWLFTSSAFAGGSLGTMLGHERSHERRTDEGSNAHSALTFLQSIIPNRQSRMIEECTSTEIKNSIQDILPTFPSELLTEIESFLHSNLHPENAALSVLYKKAIQGDADAQFELGWIYDRYSQDRYKEVSVQVDKNEEEAVFWYKLASRQSHPAAHCRLGTRYLYGQGVKKDYPEALRLLMLSSLTDHDLTGENLYRLGEMYEHEKGLLQNYLIAFKLYDEGADQGSSEAEERIAALYLFGRGVAQDSAQALRRFESGALHGSAFSERYLGFMSEKGLGVAQDLHLSLKKYFQAADSGSVEAYFDLGILYAEGQVLKRNEKKAIEYFKMAKDSASNGAPTLAQAISYLKRMGREPEAENDRIQRLLRETGFTD